MCDNVYKKFIRFNSNELNLFSFFYILRALIKIYFLTNCNTFTANLTVVSNNVQFSIVLATVVHKTMLRFI